MSEGVRRRGNAPATGNRRNDAAGSQRNQTPRNWDEIPWGWRKVVVLLIPPAIVFYIAFVAYSPFPQRQESVTAILDTHANLDDISKKQQISSSEPTLAYVTPWNSAGYDLADKLSRRLTHVSPVWLQLRLSEKADGECVVEGKHDVDQGWIARLRKGNSAIRIVPRVVLEGVTGPSLEAFLTNSAKQTACRDVLVKYLRSEKFDGCVLEVFDLVQGATGGRGTQFLFALLSSFSAALRQNSMQLIVPVRPPLNHDLQPAGHFTADHFERLAEFVDYVQVMTYDYYSPHRLGVSPLDWVNANLDYLVKSRPKLASHLMSGTNFYGYRFRQSQQPEPVVANAYLDLLRSGTWEVGWDDATNEHFIRNSADSTDRVVFPSVRTVEQRVQAARGRGVGVAVWDFGQGLAHFANVL